MTKRMTPRKSIVEFCIACMGGRPLDGYPNNRLASRRLAANCPSTTCELWGWRPGQKDAKNVAKGVAAAAASNFGADKP